MLLYIIRHAWAEEYGDPRWPDDAARPLTEEGTRRFAEMIKALVPRGFAPELVATSPFVRCRQTAELVAKGVKGKKPKLVERIELQPGCDFQGLLVWTAEAAADRAQLAWVGHCPDVENLTSALIGDPGSHLRFSKGAIAAIEFPGVPKFREGELRWLVTAKVLGV